MMDDDEFCEVIYLDGEEETTNWISRPGKARVTYPNGCIFEGTFDAEKLKQGDGLYIWKGFSEEDEDELIETARYQGNYRNGKRHGVGKMTYPNGDSYHGEWKDGKMDGQGTYTYKTTGDIYSGDFVNNKKHGNGRYMFGADKSQFVGQWVDGSITEGSWELKGAGKYEGQFQNNQPINDGVFSFENGITQGGNFVPTIVENEETGEEEQIVHWEGLSIITT